jgi:uncharacterized membrane protein YqiK
VTVVAQAEADAEKIKADAQAKTYAVEAEGQRKTNEARNAMSQAVIELEITKERLRIIPLVLAEAVKSLEKIGDAKIIDLGGGSAGARSPAALAPTAPPAAPMAWWTPSSPTAPKAR